MDDYSFKKTGEKIKKRNETDAKKKLFEDAKKTETYKKILKHFLMQN